jgi:serine/threonine protein kinase
MGNGAIKGYFPSASRIGSGGSMKPTVPILWTTINTELCPSADRLNSYWSNPNCTMEKNEIELTIILQDRLAYSFVLLSARTSYSVQLLNIWREFWFHGKPSRELWARYNAIADEESVSDCHYGTGGRLALGNALFSSIMSTCWEFFKRSSNYSTMRLAKSNLTNHLFMHHKFDYLSRISSGAYGLVLHCRCRSTGLDYAMKVQSKLSIEEGKTNLKRLTSEIDILKSCRHPYIVTLEAAFQFSNVTAMVMPLCRSGDLKSSLKMSASGIMTHERVQFYAAQLVCVLKFLHTNNIIYRDLKPENVLLQSDGHIVLADFGSAIDTTGSLTGLSTRLHNMAGCGSKTTISPKTPCSPNNDNGCTDTMAGLIMQGCDIYESMFDMDTDEDLGSAGLTEMSSRAHSIDKSYVLPSQEGERECLRATTLHGTLNYMAPEMFVLFSTISNTDGAVWPQSHSRPYTEAVDWWSLGATIFKLLTGSCPFRRYNGYDRAIHELLCVIGERRVSEPSGATTGILHLAVFGSVNYFNNEAATMSFETISFISGLLTGNADHRLGSSEDTLRENHEDLCKHLYFNGIDWAAIESKSATPPFVPLQFHEMKMVSNYDKSVRKKKTTCAAGIKLGVINDFCRGRTSAKIIPTLWATPESPEEQEVSLFDMVKYYKPKWDMKEKIGSPAKHFGSSLMRNPTAYQDWTSWTYLAPTKLPILC